MVWHRATGKTDHSTFVSEDVHKKSTSLTLAEAGCKSKVGFTARFRADQVIG